MKPTIQFRGITLGAALFFTMAAVAQQPEKTYDRNGGAYFTGNIVNKNMVIEKPSTGVPAPYLKRVIPATPSSASVCGVTDLRMGNSVNAFSIAWYSSSFLYADPNLNTIVFSHRPTPALTGDASSLFTRYDVSKDGGATWNNNVGPVYNSTLAPGLRASYPQSGIYNPVGNTKADSAYLVYFASTLNGAGTKWNGHAYGTHQLSGLKPPTQRVDTFVNSYNGWSTCMTQTGTMFALDLAITGDYLDTLIISKGTFNNTTKDFDYTVKKLYAPVSKTTAKKILDAKISFAPNGMTGFISMIGHNDPSFTTFQDSAYYPIVYKTVDGGTNWTGPVNIALKNLTGIQNALLGSGVGYTIGFENDIAVDVNGNPHIICPVGGAGSVWNFATVSTPGDWGIFDIYSEDGGVTWKAELLREPGNFWGAFGDGSNGTQFYVYPHSQASSTADGKKIFFSWFETDTLNFGSGWDQNLYPDPWMKGYDVTTKKWTAAKNMVVDCPSLMGLSTMGLVADYVFSSAGVYTIPMMYEQLAAITSTIDSVKYHYLKGIQFKDAEFGVGVEEQDKNISSVISFPNPFGLQTNIEFLIESTSSITFSVFDLVGKKVVESDLGKLSAGKHFWNFRGEGLDAGIYFLRVSDERGQHTTIKIIKE